ncbi:MAG: fumarylacetoacetate hydrolase family protein [Thermodesulfobacteriota bacterium]|jgi:2-keto-4-pentenoate hydratase/2-oxohepta-3-ene-1,7-dioic acid hydratase in catechol pathway
MKIVRYREGDLMKWGVMEEDSIREMDGDPFRPFHLTSKAKGLQEIKLLSPCLPSKIVALGVNYRDHAEEMKTPLPKKPLLFLKPSTSVIGPGEDIAYPKMSNRVDYEAELAVVIRKLAKALPVEKAAEYILGYTCLNDVTARDLQPKDGQWTTAKGFDTFAPIGPWIVTDIDPCHLEISSYLNGERRQHSNTKNLVFNPFHLVSFISHVMTLLPGDVIATGTPAGIGPMVIGDKIDIVIEEIGMLSNRVVAEGPSGEQR